MPSPLTTAGRLLVDDALPAAFRDPQRVLTKSSLLALLRRLAQERPDEYARVSHELLQLGQHAAYTSGGQSFGLKHLSRAKAAEMTRQRLQGSIDQILDDDSLDDKQREQRILSLVGPEMAKQKAAVMAESLEENNPLAQQVRSGSRGNEMNLASLRAGDLLYQDHRERTIPIPVLRSYSEGLTPWEYWAGTYGARKGVIATKFATQQAGFLSKQLNQINHRLLVTAHDEPEAEGGPRGLPVDVGDHDSVGSLLAAPAGRYPRNTVLTPKLLDELQAGGIQRILVRSPAVGGASDGGILARDAGVREFGRLPGIGENIGLAAAQALSEPISQGQLSAKHSGGVAGQEKAVSGFDYINQQVQIPKHFRGGAAHARVDGTVERIEEAPAGGYHVTIDSQPHYVAAGYPLKVQRGDRIEAGDVLSEGAPNPAEIVHYKGIGEGRRYFIGAFLQAMRDAGMRADRRNIELLSRGLINHVRLTDEFAGGIPDDVMPYSSLEHRWQPREGAAMVDPRQAVGRYLERPVLHHTIGTRVRPSMLKDFAHFGVKQVLVHPEPPPFEPEMQRGMSNLAHDPDWFTRMYGSGLKSSLQDAVHRGGVSDAAGTSFVPGLAKGVDFGHYGKVKTPKTEQTPAPKPNFGL